MQTLRRTVLLSAVMGLIILSFVALPSVSASGPKHVKVSQKDIDKYVKQIKAHHITNGPAYQWPNGAAITYSCGSLGCALIFNEQATHGLTAAMAAGLGITGVATAILTLCGQLPEAGVVGLVVAMFAVTGSWIGFADWFGGGIGVYGGWFTGSTVFYIWCNPVPSYFAPAVSTTTSTTSTDPVTTTVTQTTTITSGTSYQSSSTTQSTSTTTTTHSSTCTFANGREHCIYAPQQ